MGKGVVAEVVWDSSVVVVDGTDAVAGVLESETEVELIIILAANRSALLYLIENVLLVEGSVLVLEDLDQTILVIIFYLIVLELFTCFGLMGRFCSFIFKRCLRSFKSCQCLFGF